MATAAETTPAPVDLTGELDVLGRVPGASNLALVARVSTLPGGHVVYKPVRGEKPLWDFPDGTLAGREVAAHVVSDLGGWHVVPPTVLREGPLGAGSVQLWVGDPFDPVPDDAVVDLVPEGRTPPGWHEVFDGETPSGASVTVVHSGADDVRSLAVLDAVINNSDRKGSHCLRDTSGRLWAIDHGVTFSPTPKLRTVLWGWAGRPIRDVDLAHLAALRDALADEAHRALLLALLPEPDVEALAARVHRLLERRTHPHPNPDWPAVPWPPL
jgi:uncharacterized repeat protein (TIGR03843 family)